MVRQAGIRPVVENQPLVGLSPTMLLCPAGIRPEPAVSVPVKMVLIHWLPPRWNPNSNHH